MNKYASKEVLNLRVYDESGLLFEINTSKKNKIISYMNNNYLIIEDALIDVELANEIGSGKYQGKKLRIAGETVFRDLNGEDHEVLFKIHIAKLDQFQINLSVGEPSESYFKFYFPTKDSDGFQNMFLRVGK